MNSDWISNHFVALHQLLLNTRITTEDKQLLPLHEGFIHFQKLVKRIHQTSNKLMFIGNGGSAGIASHMAIDYSKNGKLSAMTFTDASALTCLSNDYGYEHAYAKQIEYHGRKGDVLIAISSSGESRNILNAVNAAKKLECPVMTFSGFSAENTLSTLGHLNFYVASKEYGAVEVAHMTLAHTLLDYLMSAS